MTKPFSLAFKQKMIARLTGKDAVSARQLALETGLRQQTLSRWMQETSSLPVMAAKRPRREWSIEEKIRILAQASTLTGAELMGCLQREGVLQAEYEQWRVALSEEGRASLATTKRIRALERELARKEKALAEAAALLVLKKKSPSPGGGRGRRHRRGERAVILAAINEAQIAGARLHAACQVTGLSARTIQRWRGHPDVDDRRCGPRHRPGNALTMREETQILALMTSVEYGHLSPKQLVPRLADAGRYLASESTMYRLRRRMRVGVRQRPLLRTDVTRATTVHRAWRPNQVWSWDITYLPTVIRGQFLRLYLVIDVWSRRIVGWEIHGHETAERAAALMQRIAADSGVDLTGLVLHSDNGKPMRGNTMIATLQWLGIVPSFSRPHVCNDNPYSEALFRTLKHTPAYPRLPFTSADAARQWVDRFVSWYNTEHRHSAIRYVTPDQRHTGAETTLLTRRRVLYERARQRTPERWSGKTRNWTPLGAVILNPEPTTEKLNAGS